MGMPRTNTDDDPKIFRVFFWIMFAGGLRATILWFQTLIHGIKHAKEENRVAVVLAHLLLGLIMVYLYYFSSRPDAKRQPTRR